MAKMISIGGLTGSGKTTIADKIAEHMNKNGTAAEVLDSDRIRKELWGVSETTRLPDEAYAWEITEQVIHKTKEKVKELTAQDITVIQCATYITEDTRSRQNDFAAEIGAEHKGVFITCPTDILKERITDRAQKDDNVSDATIEILERILPHYEAPTDWKTVNGHQALDKVLKDSLEALNITKSNAKQAPTRPAQKSKFKPSR